MKTHYFIAMSVISLTMLSACSGGGANSKDTRAGDSDNTVVSFRTCEYSVISKDMSNDFDVAAGSQYYLNSGSIVLPVRIGNADIKSLTETLQKVGNFTVREGKCAIGSVAEGTEATTLPATTKALGQNTVRVTVAAMTPDLIIWKADRYVYSPGVAHGISSTEYVNYYIPDNKVLTVDDLVLPVAKDKLRHALRESVKSPDGAGVSESPDEVDFSEVFYVDGYQLQFVYDQGEIGPMSTGVISLPVAVTPDMLTPLGRKVLDM